MKKTAYVMAIATLLCACNRTPSAASEATGPTATVQVQRAASGPIEQVLQAYGTVEYPPQSQSTVSSQSEATIEQILVANGQSVRRGEPLIRIKPSAAALQELHNARNDATAATQELARVTRLFGQHLATNADLTQARQAMGNARSALTSANTRVGAGGTRVLYAESDTTVVSIPVARGDIVAADAPLIHLARKGGVMVRLGIEPSDASAVKPGMPVVVSPVYDSTQRLEGVVAEVMDQVDPQTRLLQATITLPAADGLLPGSTVRGAIGIQRRNQAVRVARSALLYEGDQAYLFIVERGTARRVLVTPGIDDGTWVEVQKGLKAGEEVVVAGNYELEDGMSVASTPPQRAQTP
ncbi:efflux RND transporter periplasmic adaptor subunit [uncultured Pseudoxanthomonas sp.]|uniref:efflux RND transporter periplasmic adaptor subunit n=1 Tax=uncultured Pseudoxanthomonas sp. TaxID=281701 RepID=UPI002626BF07|nr:efflux RND transporter periplasmic adaptor subunit [uncultured Pseudoxanthomonas sp.]